MSAGEALLLGWTLLALLVAVLVVLVARGRS